MNLIALGIILGIAISGLTLTIVWAVIFYFEEVL